VDKPLDALTPSQRALLVSLLESAERPEVLSIEEAAKELRIGRSRAYEMAAAGTMPGLFRIGRSLRVSRRDLSAWVEQQANASRK